MTDEINKSIAEMRAVAAERRLLRTPSSDWYSKQAAEIAHREALDQLEKLRSADRG
jgi:hypothetical protein